ncbi:MAG: sigma-54 dependent transcriptional regulator [Nitrospiraceae bacterium]|nr:sigma-54 dependent transcriptional regulator [Nitrospiraceae bacterium]
MENKPERKILIIDDDKTFCQSLKEYLETGSLSVTVANTGAEGLAAASRGGIDIVLLDQKLPDVEGDSLCTSILNYNEQTKIIFITAHASYEGAVKAIKSGAFNYLTKPFELAELDHAIEHALRTTELENVEQIHRYQSAKESEEAVLIGEKGGLASISNLIQSAASTMAPVLITGETGTGKNVIAKAIHYRSPLRRAPFISINCAALPENLIEAELFGYQKGAFTGAVSAKKSIFEMAEGGTLLLDEIGEMPLHLQSKLLGVLEDHKIRRLGSELIRTVNVRIIAATGKDLEKCLGESFRKDLYFRLSVIRIHLPQLRERKEDIPALFDYFLSKMGGRELVFPEPELKKCIEYPWPGNIRELKNIIERSVILQKDSRVLRPSELLQCPHEPEAGPAGPRPATLESGQMASPASGETLVSLAEVERNYIRHALSRLSDNLTRTAKTLGISLSTLKRKVKEYGLK